MHMLEIVRVAVMVTRETNRFRLLHDLFGERVMYELWDFFSEEKLRCVRRVRRGIYEHRRWS
jgi:hypothetical protein